MLRVTPSTHSAAAKKYFGENLTRSDYYIDGQEVAGIWGGKDAGRLGLSGPVEQADYYALCDNLNPQTGDRLTPRTKDNRRVGYDFTFSAPKAVSVLYELTGDEHIRGAFQNSYRETMSELEQDASVRVRKGGKDEDRVTGNMVWAEFEHFTARPVGGVPDPHLHVHCFAFNASFDEKEGRFKAGQFGDIKRDADYYEAAFHTRFAKRLNDLGYGTVKDGTSFTLAGVPKSLSDKFSRRRDAIEARAKEMGVSSAEGKHAIGYHGREHKNIDIAKSELRRIWRERLSGGENAAIDAVARGDHAVQQTYTPEQAKDYALEHGFERASAIAEKRLKAEALRYGVGSVLPEQVADIDTYKDVIAVKREGRKMTTTKSVLSNELAVLQFAKDGQRKETPFRYRGGDDFDPNSTGLAGLSEEQRQAAMHLLNSRDTVTGVVGKAGTGKTRMMRATVDSIEERGYKVFVFAPSSQASRGVLKKEGFANAETLEMLLKNEKLQEQTKGQVLWVDEAGLVSGKDMRRLTDLAKRNGNRLILSGDYTQHASVEAGDAFRLLEQEGGVRLARLTEIRRQTEPGYKKAVEAIAKGTAKGAQKGFEALDKMGWVVEATGEERHRQLVTDYLKAQDEGKSALIVAPTHAEGQRLTDELRAALKERGAIGREHEFIVRKSAGWTDAQKGDVRNYEPGMVVEFHQNAKGFTRGDKAVVAAGENGLLLQKQDGTRAALPVAQVNRFDVFRTRDIAIGRGDRIRITKNGEAKVEGQAKGTRINNGDIFTVEGFTKEGDIRLENGKLLPKDWGHMSLGYVDTSYGGQGKTVDRVFIATGKESIPAANQQQWYVDASRGREMARIYVDSKQEVRNAIARGGERLSAVELTGQKPRRSWGDSFREIFDRLRIHRFLKKRAQALVVPEKDRDKQIRSVGHGS